MLIKPALNQYNWQITFIQSLSYYVLITISQYFETRPQASRPSGRIQVARIFDSYRNNERDELSLCTDVTPSLRKNQETTFSISCFQLAVISFNEENNMAMFCLQGTI